MRDGCVGGAGSGLGLEPRYRARRDALTAGNLVAADGCIEAIRAAAAAAATEADDRVLLVGLMLLADHAGRLLTL